jgi:hypothetical protein
MFLDGLKGHYRDTDTGFLGDEVSYLTVLARTNPSGQLNYAGRDGIRKLFQTYPLRTEVERSWKDNYASLA